MCVTIRATGHVNLYSVDNEGFLVANILRDDPALAAATAKVEDGLSAYLSKVESNSSEYRDEAQATANARALPVLASPVRSFATVAREEAGAFQRASALGNEPMPLSDPAYESRFVAAIFAKALPERIASVQDLALEQSSALVRHNDVDRLDLPETVRTVVRRRHAILRHIEVSGIRAGFAKRQSMSNPLGVGVDETAAYAAGDAAMVQHERRAERVQAAEKVIVGIARLVAVSTGRTPDAAFAELLAR